MVLPTRPTVSIVTPTYNRRIFIERLIHCIASQTYPHDLMEWVVYDDGTDKIEDVVIANRAKLGKITVKYVSGSSGEKHTVAAKRNKDI